MFRRSMLYHRLWYIKRRNAKKAGILLRLACIFIIMVLLVTYTNNKLLPNYINLAETRVKSLITIMVNDVINETFSGSIKYDDLVNVSKDNNGEITSIETNIIRLNILFSDITSDIQKRLEYLDRETISMPFGALLGNSIFAGVGPNLYINVRMYGNVETDFKSEFKSEGINQTKHTLYLYIKTKTSIKGFFTGKKTEITVLIPVAETVIIGKVPETFINMDK